MTDPTTLAGLWRQHADRLLMIARAWGEPAEDAVQEAFVALAQQAELPQDPLAWLVTTMRRRIFDWHRGRTRRVERERQVAQNESWFAANHDRVETALDGQQMTCWLVELPQPQREVIVMHLWGGMSFRQIAQATGDSPATANRRYQRGIEALRQRTENKPDGVPL